MHLSACGIVRSVGLCRDLQNMNARCGLSMKLPFAMALGRNTHGRARATFKAHPNSTAAPGLAGKWWWSRLRGGRPLVPPQPHGGQASGWEVLASVM